jgi:hypothetical protein
MGFLSKKSMLVPLLALSLAACAPPIQQTAVPAANTIPLPCKGNVGTQPVATTITFTGSTCELEDLDFIKDPLGNYKHFHKTKPATPGDPPDPVVFTYDLTTSVPGDGAYFYYSTKSTKSPNPDGGGGGIIK